MSPPLEPQRSFAPAERLNLDTIAVATSAASLFCPRTNARTNFRKLRPRQRDLRNWQPTGTSDSFYISSFSVPFFQFLFLPTRGFSFSYTLSSDAFLLGCVRRIFRPLIPLADLRSLPTPPSSLLSRPDFCHRHPSLFFAIVPDLSQGFTAYAADSSRRSRDRTADEGTR